MKKIKSLSIITLFLTSIVSPLQAMSLFKSMLIATCAITMTNGGVTPQPDNADNLATTLESNFLLTDNYNNPSTLRVKERIPMPSHVKNGKFFAYPIPAEAYFEGEEISLSMVVDGEKATKELPSWLTFDKETYGVYTLFGTPDYNPISDYPMEYVDYRVVATDLHGKQVSQAFTLHIKGISKEQAWGLVILIGIGSTIFIFGSAFIVHLPRMVVYEALLDGDYEEAEKNRWCFSNTGNCGFLCVRAKRFEKIKQVVRKKELIAVRLLVNGKDIDEIYNKTKVSLERLKKWLIALKDDEDFCKNYTGKKHDSEALLNYFLSLKDKTGISGEQVDEMLLTTKS